MHPQLLRLAQKRADHSSLLFFVDASVRFKAGLDLHVD